MDADPNQKRSLFKSYIKAESMALVAVAVPAGCFIGWLAGSWLDRRFHTGWIAIAGIVLGAVGGFIQLFSAASRYLKNNR